MNIKRIFVKNIFFFIVILHVFIIGAILFFLFKMSVDEIFNWLFLITFISTVLAYKNIEIIYEYI